ncbi:MULTISPECIES: hypothetical protein [unclassified Yoonia]|uniref:hypothetical protein n=1 Tax=unclassified Yoonia TaxID=2629118 RepID=UPI002AFFB42A|nr:MULTISPECIES: hypothetical protein [unclassified Yoonia]
MTPTRLRILAFCGVLIAIFLPHLTDFNYGFGSYEMVAITIGCLITGSILGAAFRNQLLFGFALGYLVYFFIDSYFLEPQWGLACLVVTFLLTPVLVRQMPYGVPLAVSVFGFVFGFPSFFATSDPMLVTRAAAVEVAATDRPDFAYLHIILDEQLSPIVDHPTMPRVAGREEVIDTYLDHGFLLYGRADSEAQQTFEAVSSIFGLTADITNYVEQPEPDPYFYHVADNRLVQRLLDSGFAPTVIGSDYLRLCGDDPRVTCHRYTMQDMMSGAALLGWQPLKRLQYALITIDNDFKWGSRRVLGYRGYAFHLARLAGWRDEPHQPIMPPLTNLTILEDLSTSVADLAPGDALIAHLLVPHRPFLFDRDCNFKEIADWRYPLYPERTEIDASAYEAFWDQSICTHRRLADLFQAIEGRSDLVVIVHGDHGSRILSGTSLSTHVDSRATFLAVRAPGFAPGLESSTVPLQATFAEIFQSVFPPVQGN